MDAKPNLSDTPAVVGGIRSAAAEASERYRALGVLDWALDQAMTDAKRSIRCIRTFLQVHRLSSSIPEESPLLESYYRDLWLAGRFVPLAKWATACPLAAMSGVVDWETGSRVHNDPPPSPDWIPFGTSPLPCLLPPHTEARGVLKTLRTRLGERTALGRPTRRARDLAWSLLGAKAMFPALWVDTVGKSLQEHAALLGSEPPALNKRAERVLEMVAESISLLATPQVTDINSLSRPRISSSAGWVKLFDQESRRWTTMRGTRAAQFEQLGGKMREELFSMDYRPWSGVREFRQHPYQFSWTDWDFDPRVSVIALQEPFKIRTISISDGPATAAASPLQKAWHGTMKQLAPFQLIGGERVADAAREVFPNWDESPFVSGDYSAATDRLSMLATNKMLTGLLKRVALPTDLRYRIEHSLMHAVMDYSRTLESFRKKVPDGILDSIPLPPNTLQRNGQLMGNILSFPILCLVNLSAYLTAVRCAGPGASSFMYLRDRSKTVYQAVDDGLQRGYMTREELDQLPVLINGDDVLFQAPQELYAVWLKTVGYFGFKPSMGKNYYSDEFFTVNSELYTRDGFRSRPWWGGFETDLIRLRQEIRFETGEDVLQADMRRVLPKMQAWLRETVSAESWPVTNKLWLNTYHNAGILEPYSGLNWFIPVELGGMGLDPSGFDGFEVTYAQRKLACRLALDPEGGRKLIGGPEGSLVTEESDRTARSLYGSKVLSGEIVAVRDQKYVLDRFAPVAVRRDAGGKMRVMMRVHPLLDSRIQRSTHVDRWLDHHTDGIRLEAKKVRDGVRRALVWGLRMSDKHLVDWGSLDVRPRYVCTRESTLVPLGSITRMV